MERWLKAIFSLAITAAAVYLLIKHIEDGHAREISMWLLGALMGRWLR